jgi:hypothetical protein
MSDYQALINLAPFQLRCVRCNKTSPVKFLASNPTPVMFMERRHSSWMPDRPERNATDEVRAELPDWKISYESGNGMIALCPEHQS